VRASGKSAEVIVVKTPSESWEERKTEGWGGAKPISGWNMNEQRKRLSVTTAVAT